MVGWLVGSLFGWLVGWLRGLLEFLDLLPSLCLLASPLATMLLRLLVLRGLLDLLGLHCGWLVLRGFIALFGLLDSLTFLCLVSQLCLASLICLACLNYLACVFNLMLGYLSLLDLLAYEDDCYKRAVSLLVGLTMQSYWLARDALPAHMLARFALISLSFLALTA